MNSTILRRQRQKKKHPVKPKSRKIGNYTVLNNNVASGAFGSILKCQAENQQVVAIKKIVWDKDVRSHEYEFLNKLNNRNIVRGFERIIEKDAKNNKTIEYIVMEYFNDSLYDYMMEFSHNDKRISMFNIKLIAYQIFSALNYLHSNNIVHCDLKPENILYERSSGIVKIADLGSAQFFSENESNNTYIVSRFYRAPELLIDAKHYGPAIDIWSTGCIIVEMLTGHTLFKGSDSNEQLKSIQKVIGKPSFDDLHQIPHRKVVPQFRETPVTLEGLLPTNTPQDLKDLLKSILVFNPNKRPTSLECMKNKFFDELFVRGMTMPNGRPLPELDAP